MATTLDQQVALEDALVPSAQRAFLVTADVPEIYMQEFWAIAKLHQHSIRFKMDTRKHEILEFLRFLGHNTQIKTLTDVNVNKLYQPWRSFAAVINKCLTGKSFGIDSFRISQAQILWGLYHESNVDYAYLIWEDFVYQVKHKSQKKSNEMYYPRFTKVIIDYFMTRKPSIPRRNIVNWHYVMNDVLFTTIKVYYACATGEAAPKPKASARKKTSGSASSSTTPPTPIATPTPTTTVVAAPRLSAVAKGKQPARATSPTEPIDVERTEAEQLKIVLKQSRQETHISQQHGSGTDKETGSRPGVPDVPSDDSEEEISWNSSDDEDVDKQTKGREEKSNEGDDEANESDRESEDEEKREQEEESFDPIPRTPKDDEDDANNKEDQGLRIGEEERMQEEEDAEELYRDVDINQGRGLQVSQETEDTHVILTPTQSDAQQESSSTSSFMTNLLNPITDLSLESVFTTDRVKFLEDNFSNISGIKIIKEQVKSQVKAQVTRILPRIEEAVNAQLEAEVLTRSSHSSRTSYAVAADLSEMELKKILIEKMEGNKSIQRSDEQRNLYNALVEAYDADKTILDTYEESTILKRRREDDDQEGPSAGSNRGSKRQREEGEHASASTSSEPATESASKTTTGLDVDKLTPELLAGPTYELMRGSCNSLTELEYHLEEVYKATTDQLDWVNPEGQQYPHNLLQPLPLIPDNQGRSVIPFEHFINNDFEYLQGGASSCKYTTSVTKTKAADYGHIKWNEDLVPQEDHRCHRTQDCGMAQL
nr:hypothetical protein [Tanacetum cinerariifolium]